jgi:heme o synthase
MRISMKLWEKIRIGGSLAKVRITFPVTATTFTGFVVYSNSLSPELLPLLAGVFLLAGGSSALNHYQERKIDACMERTSSRPIPSGQISPGSVLAFSAIMLVAGSIILFLNFPVLVLFLGLFNFFWYNAAYTPLKRITAFAVVPGSITGGIPPLIGWAAAGGSLLNPDILVIALFFIIGQIPHFWLLLLKYGNEYEMAGLPSISRIFTTGQIKRISYTWIFAALTASVLLFIHGLISHPALLAALFSGILLVFAIMAHQVIRPEKATTDKMTFITLNIFYLLVMIILVTESLIFK